MHTSRVWFHLLVFDIYCWVQIVDDDAMKVLEQQDIVSATKLLDTTSTAPDWILVCFIADIYSDLGAFSVVVSAIGAVGMALTILPPLTVLVSLIRTMLKKAYLKPPLHSSTHELMNA